MSQTLATRFRPAQSCAEPSWARLSRLRGQFLWLGFVCLMCVLSVQGVDTQRLSYSSGQNVSPGYEGWEEDPDGSRWFVFGYMNRNWDEEPHVEIGVENSIEPAGPDHGQPTYFLPRRNRFVFRVPVPDGFGDDDEMVWTLTVNGVTERAYATLRQDYFMDDIVRASEHGAIGAGTTNPVIRANMRLTLAVEGETNLTVRVGEPLSLVASSGDDGVPESPRKRILVFDPNGLNPWAPHSRVTPELPDDGRWVTEVTFDTPGTYVLRCRASDGALDVDHDLTVTVTS